MSLTLQPRELSFIRQVISESRDLLDNTHCYDTEEYVNLGLARSVMNGMTLDEAREQKRIEDDE